jgi:hypothetical protein
MPHPVVRLARVKLPVRPLPPRASAPPVVARAPRIGADLGPDAKKDALAGMLARAVGVRSHDQLYMPLAPTLQRRAKSADKPTLEEHDKATAEHKDAYRHGSESRSRKVTGEGGQALKDKEMQAFLLDKLRNHGGLTVAVYIGDESGGEMTTIKKGPRKGLRVNTGAGAEFRSQAYKFAIAHGAIGVTQWRPPPPAATKPAAAAAPSAAAAPAAAQIPAAPAAPVLAKAPAAPPAPALANPPAAPPAPVPAKPLAAPGAPPAPAGPPATFVPTLLANKAMEMTASTPKQLRQITEAAQALLGPLWTKPVKVKTLAIFTHGWEGGIRVDVDEKEANTQLYSDETVSGLKGAKQYPWIRQVAQYLSDNPRVVLYACRAAGDADAGGNHAWWNAFKEAKGNPKALKKLGAAPKGGRKGEFEEFATKANTMEEMGGGLPFAGAMREGIQQELVRRELKKQGVDLNALDKTLKAAEEAAEKQLSQEKGGAHLKGDERTQRIAALAKEQMAKLMPTYDALQAAAWKTVLAKNDVRVLSHLDRGNTTANSRLAEFAADPAGGKLGERTSFLHLLAEAIIKDVTARNPKRTIEDEEFRELVRKLGFKIIATKEGWRYKDHKKTRKEDLEVLDKQYAPLRHAVTDKAAKKKLDAEFKADKSKITQHWSMQANDEDAKAMSIRELAYLGLVPAVGLLTRVAEPTAEDFSDMELTDDAKKMMLRGMRIFHRDVRKIIESL